MNVSKRPFPAAVKQLLRSRDMSQRELARRAQEKSDGFPHITSLNTVLLGEQKPSVHMMEAVARGFNISPDYFGEYRLAMVRHSLDETEVGLGKALGTLDDLREPEPQQPNAEEKEHL